MSCGCTIYECVVPVFDFTDCPDTIELALTAPNTGVYQWLYEFNGRWFGGTVTVTQGENITLPYVFNENYTHTIKFYYNNLLVNDTCYTLDTSLIAGSYTTNTSSGGVAYLTFEAVDGAEQTNADIANRNIIGIMDGAQIYNVAQFTQNGNTFEMTNGVSFYTGQTLTLIFA